MTFKLGAALLALPLSVAPVADMGTPIAAENLSYIESGVCSGVITQTSYDVKLERQKISICVDRLPLSTSSETYPAEVCTEYTFRNATQEDEEMVLFFPVPEADGEDAECRVELGGERVTLARRYAFHSTSAFNARTEVDRLKNDKQDDAFFKQETRVTTRSYVYRPGEEDAGQSYVHLIFGACNPNRTRMIFGENARVKTTNGKVHVYWQVQSGNGSVSEEVYFIGDPVQAEQCYVSADAAGEEIDALSTFTPGSDSEGTLSRFIENLRPYSVGTVDWYNGIVDLLKEKSTDGFSTVARNAMTIEWFRPWYEYRVTVPANDAVVNTVWTSIMPRVEKRLGKYAYSYVYPLSSALCWQDFGVLEIEIKTPYSLYDPTLEFEKTQEGYSFTNAGLPVGDLSFSLTERPEKSFGNRPAGLSPSTIVAIVLLCVLAAGGIGAGVFFFIRKKHKK